MSPPVNPFSDPYRTAAPPEKEPLWRKWVPSDEALNTFAPESQEEYEMFMNQFSLTFVGHSCEIALYEATMTVLFSRMVYDRFLKRQREQTETK